MDIVEEYKHRMKTAPDDYLPGNEWDIVNELLRNPPDEIDTILEWIFVEHKGYIEPRVQAGLKFAERNPTKVWPALEHLISVVHQKIEKSVTELPSVDREVP